MNCNETQSLIHPHIDGELDLVNTVEIEKHLQSCTECAAVHRNLLALRSSIRDGSLYARAPANLERRIRASLPQQSQPSLKLFRHWPAAAAAIVLLTLGAWFATQSLRAAPDRLLASDITSAHIRSLMAEHLWDVKSTDQHTVKPWFDGKLDFAPDVHDFPPDFSLQGGRLDYLNNRPVAALIYKHDKHYLNLFIWPAGSMDESSPNATAHQGYNLLHWTHAGMNYWAISDTAPLTLQHFSTFVRNPSTATTKPAP